MSILKVKKWRVTLILLAVSLLLLGACAIYLGDYYRADTAASAAFGTAQDITRETLEDGTLVFLPQNAVTGLIFTRVARWSIPPTCR